MGLKLREKYLLLGIGILTIFGLGCLLVALRRDTPHNSRIPVRDSRNRWAAAQQADGDEFERIQSELLINASRDPISEKRTFIKGMMKFAWSNYRRFAWGHNELRPVSRIGHSASVFGASPLGASIVDGLSTLLIMGLTDEFKEAREWVANEFDLTLARNDLSVFETNIRFVGGFLSTYALSNDSLFLDKAREVADLLLPAFNTATGIPMALVNVKTGKASNWGWASGGCSILSEFGSLELEFNYLSKLTGNQTYSDKVKHIRQLLSELEKPGNLYPNYLNPKTGRFCQKHVSVGALGDSFYEYLLKSWIWGGRKDNQLKSMYDQALEGIEKNLLFQSKQNQLWYFAEMKGTRIEHKMDHLACFIAGMYALQSKNEWQPEKAAHALKLAREIGKTCHESYIRTATGIGPESFRFTNDIEARAMRDSEKYYILRPEVIEGWFYLWRVTNDPIYRDWCWAAVQAINKHCRVEAGFSGIRNVDQRQVVHDDVQQSFILAETLKYLYLVFADEQIPLDKWVFNTEAHPFPIPEENQFQN
ncbi:Alpha-1,2-Mannosidase [Aphelenchoides bicaudatus]|nr:Alpha-1,2-Mannosidase [Aphelenchoides bicaudatus]